MNVKVLMLVTIGVMALGSGDSQRAVLCGRRLAETLATICESEMVIKKSVSSSIEDDDYVWRWLSPRLAHKLSRSFQTRAKKQGGIVSECCEKSCSVDELRTYC